MLHIIKLLLIFSILACTGCTAICRIDGSYEGKVVDAETKQPLEGVVVLGVWHKTQPNFAGSTFKIYDSIEMLTGKNGEFKIPGKGLMLLSNIDEIDLVIFKAQYNKIEGRWSDFKTNIGSKNIHWDGDKAIFYLSKLNYNDRKKRSLDLPLFLDTKKMRNLIFEINKDLKELGYDLYIENLN